MKNDRMQSGKRGRGKSLVKQLLELDPALSEILASDLDLDQIRKLFHRFLNRREKLWNSGQDRIHPLEHAIANESIAVLRNILSLMYQKVAGFNTLGYLIKIIRKGSRADGSEGFLLEFIHLLKGVLGRSDVYRHYAFYEDSYMHLKGRKAAMARSDQLDQLSRSVRDGVARFTPGTDPGVVRRRRRHRDRIMAFFGAGERDWTDYRWHLKHIIRDEKTLASLVHLSADEREGIRLAGEFNVPFGITPYYLGLFNMKGPCSWDRPIRAQVLPTPASARLIGEGRLHRRHSLDFMLESETSPEELITRRYPQIAIFKPVNTCPQICSYCQRNWEVLPPLSPGYVARRDVLGKAFQWFESHPEVTEVLITGGDPLLLSNAALDRTLARFAAMDHIERIRIGTRFFVTIPFRIDERFADMLVRHHRPGRREIVLVTHFEHVSEMTPEALEAVQRVRSRGISIYNQTVFTYYNSRRFENVALRKELRLFGIDPYYTFNAKGKEETESFRVPIARLLQEIKEEARLVPGLVRADEPVFNIPGLGKNYLKAGQHHRVIAIHPDGGRLIEFHPWEKQIKKADTYIFKDMPIHDYLERLRRDGEGTGKYSSIWYYY